MTYVIEYDPTAEVTDYTPYGGNADLIYSHDPEVIVEGPAECLAGETLIYDPALRLSFAIEDLWEHEIAPHVLTLFGTKKATVPFRKGYAALYRVTLSNGYSFVATEKHKVLTSRGWVFVGSLRPSELLLGYAERRQVSNWASCLSMSLQDARSCAQIPLDCQVNYSAYSRLCDGLPQPEEDSDLIPFPLPDGAPLHNHVGPGKDDRTTLLEHSHPRQSFFRLSTFRFLRQGLIQQMAHGEYYALRYKPSRAAYSSLPVLKSQSETRRQKSVSVKDGRFVHTRSFDLSPYPDYTVFCCTLSSVEYVRHDYYYDLTVPDAGHYLADGVWHHNTGKTLAACWKSHLICSKYPGAQGAILRKTQASIYGSVLQTFQRVIEGAPIQPYGGEKPEKYIYPNGSIIWIGGMDNRDRVLSSERDFIQTCQTEEFTVDDWEYLTTRTTGRGSVIPHPQLYGDCNPAGSLHWIRERNKAGALQLIHTTHKDNPSLFDRDGSPTPQGVRTMARLAALTGVRRKRLYEGIWATAEGAVYDNFDSSVHVRTRRFDQMKAWYLAQDEGYTNPAVILMVGEDNDGRLHIFREYYRSGKLQSAVVARAKRFMNYVYAKNVGDLKRRGMEVAKAKNAALQITSAAVDEAAAGLIADLLNNGVPAFGTKGRVLDGIQIVQDRLKVQGDGLPRLTVDPSCVNTINEFESYVWKKVTNTGIVKDEPQKENDHAMDALRYLAAYLDGNLDPSKLVDSV